MALKEKILDRAQKYVQKGSFDKAIAEYRAACDVDPRDISIKLRIGDLYVKTGKTNEAIKEYNDVARANTQRGFYLKAIAVYKQVLKLDESSLEVHVKLAELYVKQRLIADAVSEYSILMNASERRGKTSEVLEILKKMVGIDPENVGIRIKLAELYLKMAFEKDAFAEYGWVFDKLMAQGKSDRAEKIYMGLYGTYPREVPVLKALARIYKERNDDFQFLRFARALFGIHVEHDDAVLAGEVCREILELRPNDQECLKYIGRSAAPPPPPPVSFEPEPETAPEPVKEVPEARAAASEETPEEKPSTAAGAGEPASTVEEIEITLEGFEELKPEEATAPVHQAAPEDVSGMEPGALAEVRQDFETTAAPVIEEAGQGPAVEAPSPVAAEPEVEFEIETGRFEPPIEEKAPVPAEASGATVEPPAAQEDEELRIETNAWPQETAAEESAPEIAAPVEEGPAPVVEEPAVQTQEAASAAEVPAEEAQAAAPVEDGSGEEDIETSVSQIEHIIEEEEAQARAAEDGPVEELVEFEIKDESAAGASPGEAAGEPPAEAEKIEALPEVELEPALQPAMEAPLERTGEESQVETAPQEASLEETEARPADAAVEEDVSLDVSLEEGPAAAGPGGMEAGPELAGGVDDAIDAMLQDEPSTEAAFAAPEALEAPVEAAEEAPVEMTHEARVHEPEELEEALESEPVVEAEAASVEADVMTASAVSEAPEEDLSEAITELMERMEPGAPPAGNGAEHKIEEPPEEVRQRDEYVDLSAELGMEEAVEDLAGTWRGTSDSVEFDEFKDGMGNQLSREDTETHYNLGIAYMEMELFSEASKEFKIALKDPKLEFECFSRLGLCSMAESNPEEAVIYFLKGLKTEGIPDEERTGMMYELALAYEAAGETEEAREIFASISAADPDYREVVEKLKALEGAGPRVPLDDGLLEVEML